MGDPDATATATAPVAPPSPVARGVCATDDVSDPVLLFSGRAPLLLLVATDGPPRGVVPEPSEPVGATRGEGDGEAPSSASSALASVVSVVEVILAWPPPKRFSAARPFPSRL
jgi:hypothetical protein